MKNLFRKRKRTRKLILQSLYSWEISKNKIDEIKKYTLSNNNCNKIDVEYFNMLIIKIPEKIEIIDEYIKNFIKKKKHFLNIIELTIIRISTFELIYCKNIPYKVIINEALELSKMFSSKLSYTFINKILDKFAKEIRNTSRIIE